MTTLRRILACVAIGVIAAVIALLSHSTRWLERLELVTWDVRQRSLAVPAPPEVPIRLILIDQASLDWARDQAGTPWPWPREFYSAIINFCRAAGAKAIVFDLFFSEPSMFGQDDDDRFATALKNSPAAVLAVPPGPRLSAPGTWPAEVPPSPFTVTGWSQWQARHPHADLALNSVVMSLPEIAGSVSALGHVRGDQDTDSIIRRVAPLVTFDGQSLPALGLAAHQVAVGDPTTAGNLRIEGDTLLVGPHHIPLDDDGMAILRYRQPTFRGGQHRMYEAFSAAGVINAQLAIESCQPPALSPATFKDCTVIIGPSAVGTYDLKPTPMNKAGPGAEVHATFLDNLLHDDFMHRSSETWVWLFTIGLSLIGAFAARESRNGLHVLLAFVFTLPLPWLVGVITFKQGAWWPIVVPALGLLLALVGGLIANYATEGRQRRFIKSSFQRYLSPAVIEQIVQDPSRLRLGGERREVSVYFSDIVGFSGIAEKLEAEDLTVLLNDYLTDMTNIILEEAGTLDKYIGDAIVAFWNAPLDQPDHAQRAARAAVRCQDALAKRRADYRQRFGADLHVRIGLNTGVASVGNFGSQGRFDYTIIGHAVNLASRLEGANKFFGTSVLIAEETWRQSAGTQRGREVGLLRVVGVHEPIRVFELFPAETPLDQRALDAFQQALALCQNGKSAEALVAFERLSGDPLAQRYAEELRSHALEEQGQWDGVWNLQSK